MPGFVASPAAISIGLTAKMFGQRPSSLLDVHDPVVALALDEAVALRLTYAEQAQRSSKAKGDIPPGQRYETTEEALEGALVN